jgi:hypothetical protein
MKALSLLFAVLLLAGCGSQPAAPVPPKAETPAAVDVSYAKDIQPMFNQSCMPCHASGGGAAKYDLTKYETACQMVLAGNPDSSKVCQMLKAGKMPPAGPLPQAKVELVSKWVTQGAKNN